MLSITVRDRLLPARGARLREALRDLRGRGVADGKIAPDRQRAGARQRNPECRGGRLRGCGAGRIGTFEQLGLEHPPGLLEGVSSSLQVEVGAALEVVQ